MQAADELFGPAGSDSDPFGAVFGGEQQAPFDQQHDVSQPGQDSSDLFAAQEPSHDYGMNGPTNGQQYFSGTPGHDGAQHGLHGHDQGHGWYDEHGQTQDSYQQQVPAAHAQPYQPAQSYTPSQQFAPPPVPTTNPYQPSTPSAPNTYAAYSPATSSYANSTPSYGVASPAAGAYDPYKPGSATPYTAPPLPQASTQPSYNAYAPSVYTPGANHNASHVGTPGPAYGGSAPYTSPSIPTPPQPTVRSVAAAEAYRPKKTNAYDPPMPAPRAPKRASNSYAHSPLSAFSPHPAPSPPIPQQAYSSYQSFGGAVANSPAVPPQAPPQRGYSVSSQPAQPPYGARATPPPPPARASPAPPPPPARASPAPPPSARGPQVPPPSRASIQSQLTSEPSHMTAPPANELSYDSPINVAGLAPSGTGLGLTHGHAELAQQSYFPLVDELSPLTQTEPASAPRDALEEAMAEDDPEAGPSSLANDTIGELNHTYSSAAVHGAESASTPLNVPAQPRRGHTRTLSVPYGVSPYDTAAIEHGNDVVREEGSINYGDHAQSELEPQGSTTYAPLHKPQMPNGASQYGAATQTERIRSPTGSNSSHSSSAYDPYKPNGQSSYSPTADRAQSPASLRSLPGSGRSSLDVPRPSSRTGPAVSPAATATSPGTYDAYKPGAAGVSNPYGNANPTRTLSPATVPSTAYGGSVHNPYAPTAPSALGGARVRAPSTGPMSGGEDPYAPSRRLRRETNTSEASDYGGQATSRYGFPETERKMSYDPNPVQELTLAPPPVHGAYAPSPTLLGLNDPLGRTSARVPVISFGAGGRVVTCFHGAATLNTGFDVALMSRQTTDIHIQLLHKIVPESALNVSEATFPGPLLNDPGTPTGALVRTGAAAQTKAKKARVTKYLEDRAAEISAGLPYLTTGTPERRHAEGKAVLVRLLKVMVEHDGKLSGSAQIDTAVRAALIPRLADEAAASDLPSLAYPAMATSALTPHEEPLATYHVKATSLDKIQDFLIRGERRKACHYASDEKLWAHAMIIASSIGQDAWKEVIGDFVRSELGVRQEKSNGREALRVAYSLFGGQGAAAVEELLPPNLLALQSGPPTASSSLMLPQPTISHLTPVSPNFPQPEKTGKVPAEALDKWPETAAMLVTSPMNQESTQALIALGDYLSANGWIEAAHTCYLLSGQQRLIGGMGAPSARVVLVGSVSPSTSHTFHKDQDPLVFSEIAEFALSLATPAKGQETFPGWPHLQAYRLIRACHLAEMGHTQLANRYCEAIGNSISRQSPYLNVTFAEQLKDLHNRLTAAPELDKGSWIGGKMSKPSLDSIGSWLEGRLTKFIAGEGESSPTSDEQNQPSKGFAGPFSHYSTISSTVPSTSPSPQPSVINHHVLPGSQAHAYPKRTGSAMSSRSSLERATTQDYTRRNGSPAPGNKTMSANPATTAFAQAAAGYQSGNGYTPSNLSSSGDSGPDAGPWWGSSYGSDSTAPTPTATSFGHTSEEEPVESGDGFISLMDNVPSSPMPMSRQSPSSRLDEMPNEDEDDDELGLGNSTKGGKKPVRKGTEDDDAPTPTQSTSSAAKQTKTSEPEKPAEGAPAKSGWLSRWWGKSEEPTTQKAVKANLGEEVSFYYDKELKRWINKNAVPEAAKPAAPPPPPSRAQTASPASASAFAAAPKPSTPSPVGTPPPRSASVDPSMMPPKKLPPRIRSSLIPSETESAPGTPAPGSGLDVPPPPSRPRSQASKKNIRSRYVDIS